MKNKPRISLIAAMTDERVIGRGKEIPWRIPEDQKIFKEITLSHTVIMGRMTYESLPAPLINRRNIVISRSLTSLPEKKGRRAEVVPSLKDALELAGDTTENNEIFIIGGAQIYTLALPLADRLYISRVRKNYPGDILFPDFPDSDWPLTDRRDYDEFTLEIRDRKA